MGLSTFLPQTSSSCNFQAPDPPAEPLPSALSSSLISFRTQECSTSLHPLSVQLLSGIEQRPRLIHNLPDPLSVQLLSGIEQRPRLIHNLPDPLSVQLLSGIEQRPRLIHNLPDPLSVQLLSGIEQRPRLIHNLPDPSAIREAPAGRRGLALRINFLWLGREQESLPLCLPGLSAA
jgi:hypothetical protein